MRTLYEGENAAFSDRAHMAAREQIYPRLFGVAPQYLRYERELVADSERGRILDAEMSVDCTVYVQQPGQRGPLVFSVQERFRRATFRHMQDITITEWNNASNTPSELHKIRSGLFVYAYFDGAHFYDVMPLDVPSLLYHIVHERIPFVRHTNRKQQDFLCFKFCDLRAAPGVVLPLYEVDDIAA